MGLLEALLDNNNFPKPIRATCSVCDLLKSLSEKEVKALEARLSDNKITHTALSRVLRANDYSISDSVIGRHRRGICQGGAGR